MVDYAHVSRGGAARKTAPVGWVHVGDGYTVRWRRGDPVAYVLDGERTGDHGMAGVVDTVPVSQAGWPISRRSARSGNSGDASTATDTVHNRLLADVPAGNKRGKRDDDSVR